MRPATMQNSQMTMTTMLEMLGQNQSFLLSQLDLYHSLSLALAPRVSSSECRLPFPRPSSQLDPDMCGRRGGGGGGVRSLLLTSLSPVSLSSSLVFVIHPLTLVFQMMLLLCVFPSFLSYFHSIGGQELRCSGILIDHQ